MSDNTELTKKISDKNLNAIAMVAKESEDNGNFDVSNILDQVIYLIDNDSIGETTFSKVLGQEYKIIRNRHLQVYGEHRKNFKKQVLNEASKIIGDAKKTLGQLRKEVVASKDHEESFVFLTSQIKAIGVVMSYLSGSNTYEKSVNALRMLHIAELCASQGMSKLATRIAIIRKEIEKELIN